MATKKKQIYILCDMEGASQISPENRKAMHYGSEVWQKEGRGFVTSDLKAVCEAANEFGIDEIIVNDEHDLGNREPNVLVKELPENVKLVNRPHLPGKPRRMTQKEPFGIIMVGQHAMYGNGGFAPHTIQSPPIGQVSLNGIVVGEIGLELALFMGVKFLAVIGEDAAVKEAQALCPKVVGCPVKSLERKWFPTAEENYPVIKEKVLQALKHREETESFHTPPPYKFSLKTSEEYYFEPHQHFPFRWIADLFFFKLYKGKMEETVVSWESKNIPIGLNTIHMMRMFMRKRTQDTSAE
jgi:D-aminopeptidase